MTAEPTATCFVPAVCSQTALAFEFSIATPAGDRVEFGGLKRKKAKCRALFKITG
jgi:hypothetical protein